MKKISDIIRQYWPRGLNDVTVSSKNLNEWLRSLDYEIPDGITDSEKFVLYNHSKSFLNVNAFEIERMACASLETHLALDFELKGKKALAWTIIKLYYSAFYAAHSIMRTMGKFCVYLDNTVANEICKNARIYYSNGFDQKLAIML